MATRDAYGRTLVELGRRNPDIVVLDADVSKGTRTDRFAKLFPDRFFNVGIAEQNMIDIAAGLATTGLIPIANTLAVFASGRTFDQIRMSLCYPCLNVKIVAVHGGISVGEDGASHQAVEDLALMRALPNMVVLVPADEESTRAAICEAVRLKGPTYVRLGRMEVSPIYSEGCPFQIGKGNVLRQGTDLAIIATGIMLEMALHAARMLEQNGLSVSVVDMHTIKPLDRELVVRIARETGGIVTAEEHSVIGGLGSAVAETLAQTYPAPVEMVGIRDTFGESGPARALLREYGLTAEDIVYASKRCLARKNNL